ncbi:valine--tRNA ligase [Candidatus Woesearchaeota archaeon CG10_big_fil_rev_8_21_14_0_10_34_12]|nr:MAG: valine--tRNA ligase [Candidatus Woesearchaeota archaeon CG10_big_fil_rev_8_21_14_0_10_34_12]
MAEENISKQEQEIIKLWEKEKVYNFNPKTKKQIYSIDTPPPTVSGKMHIGHAFSYSQQDFIARFKRMSGFEVFYPFGTDDNGLPTERLVEKTQNIKARDMERDKFVKLCLDLLKKKFQPEYISDWKRIGISCDWNILYSTIDNHSRKLSQWSFIDLYKKQRAYQKDAPAMWCPECQTGISQVECEDKEKDSSFNDIVFKVDNKELIIATTRPELLPACVAVFYNPTDKRYKKLKGKKAKVPLFNFEVPMMEDSRADPEIGTGIVMCCTFGDQTDMEWQKAYNLPIKEAITKDGKMSSLAKKYSGMTIKEARKAIIEDLKENKLLIKQTLIKHAVKVHERCGTEVEFVKSKQWFVKYLDLKDKMLKWGKELKWYPEFMVNRYSGWVKGLQWDWLISRQRFFGVPFPVWYCKKCNEIILAEESQLPVDPLKDKPKLKCRCGSSEFEGESDILDTWFTSSLTPRLSIELMPKELWNKLYPMNLRPQASEIITFWLFNTVVKSNLHYNKNPFKDVAISGFVTLGGQKMSKSRGNIVEPQEVFEKYGADSLRYWAAGSKLGDDLEYNENEILAGKKFVTKLKNAANFVFMNLKSVKKIELIETDRLFLNKLNEIIIQATKDFNNYEYHKVKLAVEGFFWRIFCDNYLEIVKWRVYNGNEKEKTSANYTLYQTLLAIIKLMAPITVFITEEVYQQHFKKYEKDKSIHVASWPEEIKIKSQKTDEEVLNLFLEIISKVRQTKSEAKKSMKAEIILYLEKDKIKELSQVMQDLKTVTNSKEIKEGKFKVEFV